MGGRLKMKRLMVALAVTFVIVNLVLYKQTTLSIAHILDVQTSRNASITATSSTEQQLTPTTKPGDAAWANSSPWQANWVLPTLNPQLVKTYTFLSEPIINPHPFNYTIYPSKVNCSGRDIEIVLCIPIRRNNFDGRQTVRETWGSYANVTGNRALLVFFIGSDEPNSSGDTQRRIEDEARDFGDILQESYIDHYNNLSLKSVSIVKWFTTHCPGSKYLLKADDDIYVNVPLLIKTMDNLSQSSGKCAFVVGVKLSGTRPIRNSNSKWYTPYNIFKGEVYPIYVAGPAYAMNAQAAWLLYEASLRVTLFWIEDVYVTGLCAAKAGVSVIHSDMFRAWKPVVSGCTFRAHISGHWLSLNEIRLIHKQLYDPKNVCEKT